MSRYPGSLEEAWLDLAPALAGKIDVAEARKVFMSGAMVASTLLAGGHEEALLRDLLAIFPDAFRVGKGG